MAFVSLNLAELAVGKPVKKSLFTTIKDNEDDLETRLDSLEGGVNKVIVGNFSVVGYISHYSAAELTDVSTFRAPSDFNLLEFSVTITDSPNAFDSIGNPVTTSSAGQLELDLKKSTDGGVNFYTILTTKPAIVDGQSGKGVHSNDGNNTAVVIANTAILQDDLLRIDVTGLKDIQGTFNISCYGSLD